MLEGPLSISVFMKTWAIFAVERMAAGDAGLQIRALGMRAIPRLLVRIEC